MTIERTRYFTGQLLDEDDLTQEQLYFREKARRHNCMLHGWGIVSGLAVSAGPTGGELTVEPGYALDRDGDEIVVSEAVSVDLFSEDDDGYAVAPCPRPDDQVRKRVRMRRSPERPSTLQSATRSARVVLSQSARPWSTAERVRASRSSS